MKTKRYLVISMLVGASVIAMQARLALAEANRALENATQKNPIPKSPIKKAQQPVEMTEELAQLVQTLAAAANPNDVKENVTQVVSGDPAKNELFIFGEEDPIPEEVMAANPNAAIAVMGGEDAKAIKKIEDFKKKALIVAEKISNDRARIYLENLQIAAGLKQPIGTINRETLYSKFALTTLTVDEKAQAKHAFIQAIMTSRPVVLAPLEAKAPVVATNVILPKPLPHFTLNNFVLPKAPTAVDKLKHQRYQLHVQAELSVALLNLDKQKLEFDYSQHPLNVEMVLAALNPAKSIQERINQRALHVEAALSENLLNLEKQKFEFDYSQHPLNVERVMAALHPAASIQERIKQPALHIEAPLNASLIAFTEHPIVFPVYAPRPVQGLSLGKAFAYVKHGDPLKLRLQDTTHALPIHVALSKSLIDVANLKIPKSDGAGGLVAERARVALKHQASREIALSVAFNHAYHTLPVTAHLDHSMPAFLTQAVKAATVAKPKVTTKQTIQTAQLTKRVVVNHAVALQRVERQLSASSEEPRPVVIRPDAYQDEHAKVDHGSDVAEQQSSRPEARRPEPKIATARNQDLPVRQTAPRKQMEDEMDDMMGAGDARHEDSNPFNIAAMDDDPVVSNSEAADLAFSRRHDDNNIGTWTDD